MIDKAHDLRSQGSWIIKKLDYKAAFFVSVAAVITANSFWPKMSFTKQYYSADSIKVLQEE